MMDVIIILCIVSLAIYRVNNNINFLYFGLSCFIGSVTMSLTVIILALLYPKKWGRSRKL